MSGRRISQNVDASESFVDGRNSGFLETIGAYPYGSMIYGRLHIWETPTKGEDGLGRTDAPGSSRNLLELAEQCLKGLSPRHGLRGRVAELSVTCYEIVAVRRLESDQGG